MTPYKLLLVTLLALLFICSTSVEAKPRHHHPKPSLTGLRPVRGHLPEWETDTYRPRFVIATPSFKLAILNFRRKSTTGWSIGNILLDFTGGSLDIIQMGLQCWNVADWTAFHGNPVKFGLGLVSMLFDILFMIQHYILYPHREDKDRGDEGEGEIMEESDKERRDGRKSEKSHEKSNEMSDEEQRDDSRKLLDEQDHGKQKGLEKGELMPTEEMKPMRPHANLDVHFQYDF